MTFPVVKTNSTRRCRLFKIDVSIQIIVRPLGDRTEEAVRAMLGENRDLKRVVGFKPSPDSNEMCGYYVTLEQLKELQERKARSGILQFDAFGKDGDKIFNIHAVNISRASQLVVQANRLLQDVA
jgi:tyrosyl-tRNA synthetase